MGSIGRGQVRALVLVALLLPLVATAVRTVVDPSGAPSGDVALMEVRVRDVGSQTPLLGSYGRYGFNHPGPLLFYLFAIPYRLVGSRFLGMELGTLALGAASIVAIAWVTHRRGGRALLLWAGLLLGLLVRGVGPAWVANPWEPHGLLLPCAALLVLAFDAAAGRAWTLPLVAAVATLLAQAQATLLPFAVALGAFAVVGVLVAARPPDVRSQVVRAVGVAAAVTGVLWVPTVVEQLTREPGNLTAMANGLDRPEAALGLADGARLVAIQLGLPAPWLGSPTPLAGFGLTVDPAGAPLVPVGAVALVVALAAAVRRRHRSAWLAASAVVGAVAAALALSRLLGPPFIWIPQWSRVIGFGCWLAVGWVAGSLVGGTLRGRLRRPAAGVVLAALVVVSIISTGEAVTASREADPLADVVGVLTTAAAPALDGLPGPVLITSTASPPAVFGTGTVGMESLVLALERAGTDTVVERGLADRYGPARAQPELAVAELRLALQRSPVPQGFRVVATADPLRTAERAERTALLRSVGLGPDGRTEDVEPLVDELPAARSVIEGLRRFSDLPPFVLLLADPPG